MFGEGEPGEGMVVAFEAYGFGVAYFGDDADALPCLADAEPFAGKDVLVALGAAR